MNIKETIIREANLELARRDFFHYCHLTMPKLYKYDRPHLIELAKQMQEFLESDDDVLVVNVPP